VELVVPDQPLSDGVVVLRPPWRARPARDRTRHRWPGRRPMVRPTWAIGTRTVGSQPDAVEPRHWRNVLYLW